MPPKLQKSVIYQLMQECSCILSVITETSSADGQEERVWQLRDCSHSNHTDPSKSVCSSPICLT